MILLGCAMLSVFGSNVAQFSGAGALGVLVMATVASYGWGDLEKVGICYIRLRLPLSLNLSGKKQNKARGKNGSMKSRLSPRFRMVIFSSPFILLLA